MQIRRVSTLGGACDYAQSSQADAPSGATIPAT